MKTEFNSRKKEERRIKEQRKIPCFIDKDRRIKDRRKKIDRREVLNKKIKEKRSKEFRRHVDAQR